MEQKKIEDLSILELKGLLFDLNNQAQQIMLVLQKKLKEEQDKVIKEGVENGN